MAITWKKLAFVEDIISDAVFGAGWDGVTTIAPSKNAVYDKIVTLAASGANSDITSLTGLTTPLFQAKITSIQTNVTGDGTGYNITGAIWTEISDRVSNFSNGTFTAPSAGEYEFCGSITLDGISAAHTYGNAQLVTSNRNYVIFQGDFRNMAGAILNLSFSFAIIADMDAGDTANLYVTVQNGTKIVDVTANTHFSGYLLP